MWEHGMDMQGGGRERIPCTMSLWMVMTNHGTVLPHTNSRNNLDPHAIYNALFNIVAPNVS